MLKVEGGARILPNGKYGDASVSVVVSDNDQAYGVVQFSNREVEFVSSGI